MRNNILLLLCLVFTHPMIYGQGAPVIDAAHILESIHNGYQIYLQVQNLRQQLEYTYESMKAQMQAVQEFDYGSIDSFVEAVSFVDRQLSYVRQTENRLKNMRVRVGRQDYNLIEMYKVPGATLQQLEDDMSAEMDVYDRARAWSHYGLRPANYLYVETWKKRLNTASQKLAAMADTVEDDLEESSRRVDGIMEEARRNGGTTAQLQAQNELLVEMIDRLNKLISAQQIQGQLLSDQAMLDQEPVQIMSCSDDFIE